LFLNDLTARVCYNTPIEQNVVIFAVTLVATLLSSMSGGGAGIIVFPALLAMGISYPFVAAISAVSAVFWVLPASRNYLKGRVINWPLIITFSAIGLVGCYLGVLFITSLNQRVIEVGVGIIILFLVTYTYFKKDLGLTEHKVYSRARKAMIYPFALIMGFYEAVFGSGNGIFFTMLVFYTKGFDFIDGIGHYYVISFSWVLFSAILLITKGYYNIPMMIFATLGSVLGGFLGSRYAKNKGNKFIKIMFVTIGSILGLKLLLGL